MCVCEYTKRYAQLGECKCHKKRSLKVSAVCDVFLSEIQKKNCAVLGCFLCTNVSIILFFVLFTL